MSQCRDILERMKHWSSFGGIPNDFEGETELIQDVMDAAEEIKRLRGLLASVLERRRS